MKFYGKIFCAFLAALTLSTSAPAFAEDTPAESAPGEIKLYADSERTKELTASPEAGQTVYASVVCREGYYPYSLTVDGEIAEDGGIVIPENGKLSASAQLVLAGDIAVDGKVDMKDLVLMIMYAVDGGIPDSLRHSSPDIDTLAGNYDGKMSGENGSDPIDNKDVIQMVRRLSGWKNELYPEKEYSVAANIRTVDFTSMLKITRGEEKHDREVVINSVEELKNFLADVKPDSGFLDELVEKWGKDEFDPEKYRDEICWSTDDIIAGYGEEFFNEHTLLVVFSSHGAFEGYERLNRIYCKDGKTVLEYGIAETVPYGYTLLFYQFAALPKNAVSSDESFLKSEYPAYDYLHTHDVALSIGE